MQESRGSGEGEKAIKSQKIEQKHTREAGARVE